MSNILFGQFKLNLASKAINLASDTIKAGLITCSTSVSGYVALIASSTNATPIVISTSAPHGMNAGDIAVVGGHLTNTAANGTWLLGSSGGTTLTLTTKLDGVSSVGNGVGGATGYVVDITTPSTIANLGGNGGVNANGTDITLTGQSAGAYGVFNAAAWTWSSVSALKTVGIALYDSTASNYVIGWIDGMQQILVTTTAPSSSTSIAVNRLSCAIASGTTIVFSNGASATLTSQASVGATSLAVSSTAASIAAGSTADVMTYNVSSASTSGLPLTPGAGMALTFNPDTGTNKIFVP